MGQKQRFRVFNTQAGDHIAVIEMDEDLLAPDAGILDHNSATLRPIKGGGIYTLVPIEDHKVAVLKRIKEIYKNITTKPAKLFSTHISRMDDILNAVGLLFGSVEYVVIDNKDDMEKLINPPKDLDYEPKKIKYTVLDDMLKEAGADHECGPGCGHDHDDQK